MIMKTKVAVMTIIVEDTIHVYARYPTRTPLSHRLAESNLSDLSLKVALSDIKGSKNDAASPDSLPMAPEKTEKREYLLQGQSVELVCYAGDLASDLRKHYYRNDI